MPDNILRKIILCVIVAIIVPPLYLFAHGPRWYKALRLKAYDLSLRYWHIFYPMAWCN